MNMIEPKTVISSIGPQVRVSVADGSSSTQVRLQAVHPRIAVSPVGARGLPGSSAGGGASANYVMTAGANLSGHRAVYIANDNMLYPASASNLMGRPVGITAGAALLGTDATVIPEGVVDEPSWSWQPGAIYLGEGGLLTQVVPSTGVIFEMGSAAGPTRMRVDPRLIAALIS